MVRGIRTSTSSSLVNWPESRQARRSAIVAKRSEAQDDRAGASLGCSGLNDEDMAGGTKEASDWKMSELADAEIKR